MWFCHLSTVWTWNNFSDLFLRLELLLYKSHQLCYIKTGQQRVSDNFRRFWSSENCYLGFIYWLQLRKIMELLPRNGIEFLRFGGSISFKIATLCFCCYAIQRFQLNWTIVSFFRSGKNINDERADPRVADWTLMTGPLPLICILTSYLLIIYRIGPS